MFDKEKLIYDGVIKSSILPHLTIEFKNDQMLYMDVRFFNSENKDIEEKYVIGNYNFRYVFIFPENLDEY